MSTHYHNRNWWMYRDIESLPFFEAVRQAKLDLKKLLNIHLTLIPYLSTSEN